MSDVHADRVSEVGKLNGSYLLVFQSKDRVRVSHSDDESGGITSMTYLLRMAI